MPKRKLPIKVQQKLLRECVVRGKENPQLQVILDADNEAYYLLRAKELITGCLDMSLGKLVNEKLKMAQILLNIVRAKCEQQNLRSTVQKGQKQLSNKK